MMNDNDDDDDGDGGGDGGGGDTSALHCYKTFIQRYSGGTKPKSGCYSTGCIIIETSLINDNDRRINR